MDFNEEEGVSIGFVPILEAFITVYKHLLYIFTLPPPNQPTSNRPPQCYMYLGFILCMGLYEISQPLSSPALYGVG